MTLQTVLDKRGNHTTPRRKIWPLLLLALALLAAQCQTPPTPALPAPPKGPVIHIALLSPTAGEMATFGKIMRSGSLMAFEEWNNRGGLLGRRITWDIYPTDCRFNTTPPVVQQAINQGRRFIIGPLCSEAAIAAANKAEAGRVLLMAPAATHPLVTTTPQGSTRPTVFRAGFVPPLQAEAMARFAYHTLKARRAALLTSPGNDYGGNLANAFAQQFTALGGNIVHRAAATPAGNNFDDTLMAIRNSGADIIYLPVAATTANQVAARLASAGPSGPILLGSDSWESPELDLAAVSGSYFTPHFVRSDPRPAVQSWATNYKATYAVEPDTLAALGYDAALLLLQAIQQTGALDPLAVAQTLEQGTFTGVTGPIQFDARHNPIKPVPIVQVRDGQIILTSP